MRKFWPWAMILCFGVLDAVSTLVVFWKIGSFEYELGLLPNLLYSLGDIEAVLIFKLMLTMIAAILLYYIAKNIPSLSRICTLICAGASVVGLFAAASNLTGAFTGSTLWIFGVRGDTIAYILFTLFFVAGIIDLVLNGSKSDTGKKAGNKPP